MGRMVWNPKTGKFEEQYTIPMPPSATQPEPEPPKEILPVPEPETKPWKPSFDTSKPAPPPGTHQLTPTTPVVEGPPKETTAKKQHFLTRVGEIKTRLQYRRLKKGIKPDETYYIPEVTEAEIAERRRTDPGYEPSYRVVAGHQLLSEYDASYQEYQEASKKERMFWKKGEREWHPGTKIAEVATKTGLGYEVRFPYAGAEHYAKYKKELETKPLSQFATKLTEHDILGISSFVDRQRGKEQKALDTQIQALHKIRTDTVMTAVTSPVALAPWYVVGGIGLKAGMAFTAGKLAARPIAKVLATRVIPAAVGGAALTYSGADIVQTYQRGEVGRAAGKLTGLGIAVVGIGVGYKLGAKVTIKGVTPKELGIAKALSPTKTKIDIGKLPVLKQMTAFKEYHTDIRIARGMKFGDITQPSYGKLPSYLGRTPYGKKGFVSTLEQMKGTLLRTGWRGDILKAGEWAYYHSTLTQPKITPRMLSAIKYKVEPTTVSISKVYDVKWKLPRLATGEMPSRFQTAQVPVKVTGYKTIKGFTLKKPTDITKAVTPKTDVRTVVSQRYLQSVLSKPFTQTRMFHPTFYRGYTLRDLQFLDKLKPPYETYAYPKGTRIGVLSLTPKDTIIPPVTGLISGDLTRGLHKSIFGDVGTKKWFDFRQLLKGGQKQITDIISEQTSVLVPATITISGIKSLQASLTAQTSLTKTLLKQKTALATIQKSAVKTRQPITLPRTGILKPRPKPTTTRTTVTLPHIPIRLFGRGKRFLDWELYGKKYKFRKFELESPFKKKKKKKKKGKKKGGKKK